MLIQDGLGHAGRFGDFLHGRVVEASGPEEPQGHVEQLGAAAGGGKALPGRLLPFGAGPARLLAFRGGNWLLAFGAGGRHSSMFGKDAAHAFVILPRRPFRPSGQGARGLGPNSMAREAAENVATAGFDSPA
jgi:hypothetical protein